MSISVIITLALPENSLTSSLNNFACTASLLLLFSIWVMNCSDDILPTLDASDSWRIWSSSVANFAYCTIYKSASYLASTVISFVKVLTSSPRSRMCSINASSILSMFKILRTFSSSANSWHDLYGSNLFVSSLVVAIDIAL